MLSTCDPITSPQFSTPLVESEPMAWYAVRVKSRQERIVAESLEGKGYGQFLPLYRTHRRWADRQKALELPLFPGYVFCRFNPQRRLPILVTPGVVSIVGFGKMPEPVAPEEIAAIQAAIHSGVLMEPWPFLHAGQRVRVEYGSLAGVEGIFVKQKSRHRLILSVALLQRSLSVEIDRELVRAVD